MSLFSPTIEFTPEGPQVPETAAVLEAVQNMFNEAFGGTLNLDASTPQGQLITSITAMIVDKNQQLLFLANQFNPDVASGVWQDALARIYFINRRPALPTVVHCLCTGLVGTVIPGLNGANAPAQVKDSNGMVFTCQTGGVIPQGGNVLLPFQAVTSGPVVVAPNTVTSIVAAIPGWDTVNNPQAGSTGQFVESRAELEYRRRNSVASNGQGSTGAIYAAVFEVDGVIDCIVRENVTSASIYIGAVELVPHSVYVSVVGGADADIARAIADKKSAGCDMNGNTDLTLVDPLSGAQQRIRWERPASFVFGVQVTIAATSGTPSDIVARIRAAVVANFEGTATLATEGSTRVQMGSTVYASRFYCSVVSTGVQELVSIKLAAPVTTPDAGGAVWLDAVTVEINQFPTLDPENVLVVVQ